MIFLNQRSCRSKLLQRLTSDHRLLNSAYSILITDHQITDHQINNKANPTSPLLFH